MFADYDEVMQRFQLLRFAKVAIVPDPSGPIKRVHITWFDPRGFERTLMADLPEEYTPEQLRSQEILLMEKAISQHEKYSDRRE